MSSAADAPTTPQERNPRLRAALIRFFQISAIAEAITWTGLLIGMALKYLVVGTVVGVKTFGPLHGIAMVLYVFSVLLVKPEVGWDRRVTAVALAASVPPFVTWPFERWALRRWRAEDAAAAS
jgi:integral membrane protein